MDSAAFRFTCRIPDLQLCFSGNDFQGLNMKLTVRTCQCKSVTALMHTHQSPCLRLHKTMRQRLLLIMCTVLFLQSLCPSGLRLRVVSSELLVVSGSKETVHIFRIKVDEVEEPRRDPRTLALVGGASHDLFRAGSKLLSSVAATAGSSFSFVKGEILSWCL